MPKINTYTDNATIEDVDALLTYDPAGNGATKLTTFARIASWISSKLSALTKKTSIASTDQILMVDGAASPVVTKRIDYNVLAKAIIEQYASSSLAGANQSVKTAIDALNSKWSGVATGSFSSWSDMIAAAQNANLTPLIFRVYAVDETNLPTTNNQHFGIASLNLAGTYGAVLCLTFNTNVYVKSVVGGTWSNWVQK